MPDKHSFLTRLRSTIGKHHESNKEKGVYGYMWWSGLKIIIIYFIVMVPLILLFKYLVDLNPIFDYIVNKLSDGFILLVFLLSESILGMIPPDIFVIWTGKFSSPMLFIVLLGILSYIGGIISYFIGHWFSTRPKIKAYSERALNKYIILARKWGGAFIIISALFPFSPFSMVVIAVSLLKYPLRLYIFFGISRIFRFVIQGIFYLKILNLDTFFHIL
jgi:membrane protein YqaA with SNARE-associated domain